MRGDSVPEWQGAGRHIPDFLAGRLGQDHTGGRASGHLWVSAGFASSNFIGRDTFRLFGCDANVPTFLYYYPEAVQENFLVDFSLYQAHTSFQRKGIPLRFSRLLLGSSAILLYMT